MRVVLVENIGQDNEAEAFATVEDAREYFVRDIALMTDAEFSMFIDTSEHEGMMLYPEYFVIGSK